MKKITCLLIFASLLLALIWISLPTIAVKGAQESANVQGVAHVQLQGFDTCSAPSLDRMQQWWWHSPYWYIGIYIGGISRGCSQPNLSRHWISETTRQGWKFLPTWVGPQAPCTSFPHKFSSNTNQAYQQGKNEAIAAAQAARNLGLNSSIIYYDMERYNDNDTSCRQAVKAFLKGWVYQLHYEGFQAGVYASPCNADDYYYSYPRLDGVWAASWIYNQYTSYASPYGMTCLPDSYWQHRRIRQYAGDHREQWGGVPMWIDSNVADGLVATSVFYRGGGIQSFGLLPNVGWIVTRKGQIWLTRDMGRSWENVTPPFSTGTVIEAKFLTPYEGWAVQELPQSFEIAKFYEGKWERMAQINKDWRFALRSQVHLSVTPDGQHLWMNVRLPTSGNFNLGVLFRSVDGGRNWEEVPTVPAGGPLYFENALKGWLLGGPLHERLFYTLDGGESWKEVKVQPAPSKTLRLALPVFENEQSGWFIAYTGDRYYLYVSKDGGKTWKIRSEGRSSEMAEMVFSSQNVLVQKVPHFELPKGTVLVVMPDAMDGWAYAWDGRCEAKKKCVVEEYLYVTRDGGKSWDRVVWPDR